jgi:hypothetical protein
MVNLWLYHYHFVTLLQLSKACIPDEPCYCK